MNDRLIYRLKPARTEAIQLTGLNEKDVDMFCFPEHVYYYHYSVGDWLVRGVDGEIYVIKDNTFRALFTFEKKLQSF